MLIEIAVNLVVWVASNNLGARVHCWQDDKVMGHKGGQQRERKKLERNRKIAKNVCKKAE